jgi:hypothetical protein
VVGKIQTHWQDMASGILPVRYGFGSFQLKNALDVADLENFDFLFEEAA